jgi:hypothetical protein
MQTGASGDAFTLTTVNSTTVDTTNLEATNLKAKDGTAAGSIANSTGVVTLASSVLTTTDINGGTVDGTTIGATTPSTVVATQVDITAQGDLRLQDTTGGQYVALQAPGTVATSYTLTLPVDDGTSGQALITDGSGVLSWSSAASGDVYGPASATDNAVARYDGTTGKIIQNSAVTIADDGATVIAANSTTDGLRITQTGTGNALLVEDAANPDSSPTVIDADGRLILGSTSSVTVPNYGGTASGFALQTVGTASSGVGYVGHSFGMFNNSTAGAGIFAVKSRNGTVGSHTIVNSGDKLFAITAAGSDAANYIRAADISFEVDGTPGTNDMPGRLVFSTTADGASSPTERMRIDSTGRFLLGTSTVASAGTALTIGLNPTGGTNGSSITFNGTIQSAVTNTFRGFNSAPSTQATAFTLSNLYNFAVNQGTFGLGSTVTNQFGFFVESTLTGATNNYGFFSNIASGTGRWNFYANGTADNYFAGNVGLGITTPATNLDVAGSSSTSFPIIRITDTNTASANQVQSALQFYSADLSSPAAASIRAQIDIFANANGGASELRFLTNDGTLTERFRIAANGTISLGAAPGAESLRVTPVASAVNFLQVNGAATGGNVIIRFTGSDTNVNGLYAARGAGQHRFFTNDNNNEQFQVSHTASAVNYLQVTGAATGNPTTLASSGSDTNIDIALTPKGTGVLRFGTHTVGILAQSGYITIKDAAGNTRNLLVG